MTSAAVTFWCERALIDGTSVDGVRLHAAPDGTIAQLETGVPANAVDITLGTVIPGMGDAHSHAFHRALRGRTHGDGGDFWRWRENMYAAASALDPDLYYELASAVFAEMLVSGWTAVGEFHYVHHQQDGRPYPDAHAMELAVAAAARNTGIRLTLLDTCYLRGGANRPLSALQRRFGDDSAGTWLRRWASLRDALGNHDGTDARTPAVPGPAVTLGAALHSVRAVPRDAMATILAELPATVPLHIHLSEQPQENEECLAEYGLTPTGLLHELGALTARLSVVHATHLTDADIELLGGAGVTAVFCPTTEADLGDGIGPARRLADAGARIAFGSDQNAVVDPFLEARGLEAGERLSSGRRGRFSPPELTEALTRGGYASLGLTSAGLQAGGLQDGGLQVGAWLDLVELDTASTRMAGARPDQFPLVATASDVRRVIVGGRVVANDGLLVSPGRNPAVLLGAALRRLDETITHIASRERA